MSDKPELKPCPFCGEYPEILERKCVDTKWAIFCRNELCFLFVPRDAYKKNWHNYTVCFTDKDDAVITWNTRTDLAKPSEWISVETEKPRGNISCLVVVGDGGDEDLGLIHVAEVQGGKILFIGGHFYFDFPPVTHWQPLPEAPK